MKNGKVFITYLNLDDLKPLVFSEIIGTSYSRQEKIEMVKKFLSKPKLYIKMFGDYSSVVTPVFEVIVLDCQDFMNIINNSTITSCSFTPWRFFPYTIDLTYDSNQILT